MLVLALFVRFLHFALFDGTLIEPHYYAVDAAFCLMFGLLGFRITRTGQMISQYRWLYSRAGPMSWTENTPPT
jgi:hypothetical protein